MNDFPLTLTAVELREIMAMRFPFANGIPLDRDYNVPSETAITTYFKELASELFDKYGDRWQEYFDCDNFSIEALALACRKHWIARYAGNGSAQGIALGILCYRLDPANPSSGHCVNWYIGTDRQVHVFEPQTRQPLALTTDQCASAFFWFCS
jgi:hypothetical protein